MQHIIFMYQYITTWWNSLKDTCEESEDIIDNNIFDNMYDYK